MTETPRMLGRYSVLEALGRGGHGTVFRATDPLLERTVAIKLIQAVSNELRERLVREAQISARLDHPGITRVHDIGIDGDDVYVVQEFLDGQDLDHVLAEAPGHRLPASNTVALLGQIADAVGFAHRQGVVHRDLKPSNIRLLDSGRVKILDFGVARLEGQSSLTQTGIAIGTPRYASPEQLMGSATIERSADVFSFGALAYEMLTGHRAFTGDSLPAILYAVLHAKPDREPLAGLPEGLIELVLACLEKEPSARPTMEQIAERLRAIAREPILDVAATPPQSTSTSEPPLSRPHTPPPTSDADSTVAPPPSGPPAMPAMNPATASPAVSRPTAAPATESTIVPGTSLVWESRASLPLQVGRFTLHELVARGQTGALYKAFDPVRGELIGLKVVELRDDVTRERLLRAGRIWLRFVHANILRVLDIDPGHVGGQALVVTELVDGVDLKQLATERSLRLDEKLLIVGQVADALAYIHQHGVIHREIKPRNILVNRETLKTVVLDSGLAREANPEVQGPTRIGTALGDLRYMALEQFQGRPEQRSDLYSLAAVLFELTLGREPTPHRAAAMREAIEQRLELPVELRRLLLRGLADDPSERFATASELQDALRDLQPGPETPKQLGDTVVPLHGIRTHALWQRAFSDVANDCGFHCRLERWSFGYFSVFAFIQPWARTSKVAWFRRTYRDEFPELYKKRAPQAELPSIVAHSFGTYILGNALLRYPYLRFDKVILCGSILPRDYPWPDLIERGQVQSVRNEFGTHDIWTSLVRFFIPGTGDSGTQGFTQNHPRLQQERFGFSHSEYFERAHMESTWIPFLNQRLPVLAPQQRTARDPTSGVPWGLYAGMVGVGLAAWALIRWL